MTHQDHPILYISLGMADWTMIVVTIVRSYSHYHVENIILTFDCLTHVSPILL